MASIARRPSGAWRARYRDVNGREHSKHFIRKVDAQRWLDEVTTSVLTGRYVDPRAGKALFDVYARQWQSRQMHRENIAKAVDSALRTHLLPAFAGRRIDTIRPGEVQKLVRSLSDGGLAPSTVGTVFQHLRAIFLSAQKDRVIAESPCAGITLPKGQRAQVSPLSTAVVEELTEAIPRDLKAMIVLMAGSGLRPGEAAGLTVDRVGFMDRDPLIRVDRQLLQTRPPSFGPPKTEASYRSVPLPHVVHDALAAHLAEGGEGNDRPIFHQCDGRPLNRDKVGIRFRAAVNAVGAPTGTSLHDLRHYYASLLIHDGASVKVVQARLGHATATETLDTYAHLWPESNDLTRATIDAALGRLRTVRGLETGT